MRSLARDSVRGAAWLFATGYMGFIVNFLVNLLVARLVLPEEFGLFAVANALNELIGILGAFSIPLALIYLDESEPHLFDTGAWMMMGLNGVSLVAALVTGVLLIPGGLSSEAGGFLAVLALARVLSQMSKISGSALEKNFSYKSYSTLNFLAIGLPNFLCLGMAWMGFGARSLVGREVSAGILSWLLIGFVSPFRFRGHYDPGTARKIFSYCRRMFVSRGLEIVFERFDRLLVGAWSGTRMAGLYDRSRYISEVGMTIVRPADTLSFNLYSRLRDERERLVKAYFLLSYFLVRLMMGLSLILLVFPREVVLILLGPNWLEATGTIRWMALYAGLYPFYNSMKNLLYGRGMMRESNRVKFVLVGCFVPLFALWIILFGTTSSGFVLSLAILLGIAMMFYYQGELLYRTLRELFVVPLVAFAVSAGGLVLLASRFPAPETATGSVLVLALAGVAYCGVLYVAERERLTSRVRLVLSQLQG